MIQMAGASGLREALELYDWSDDHGVERRIDAIESVTLAEHQQMAGPRVHREIRMHVRLDPNGFDGPGDAALFGDVLGRFVGRYANFHHSMRLVLEVDDRQTVYPRMAFEGAPF